MELDHIAVSGVTLEDAVEAVEAALGVPMQPGGRHERFGTHNRLLGLAGGLYLEAIAVDPAAPKPDRPRWFGLDEFTGAPRLSKWIVAVDDLDAALRLAPPGAGEPLRVTRGDLSWRMAVPADGHLPFDGLFPALIEWEGDAHPAPRLDDCGLRLARLVISSPNAMELGAALAPILNDERVEIVPGDTGMRALFEGPDGPRELR